LEGNKAAVGNGRTKSGSAALPPQLSEGSKYVGDGRSKSGSAVKPPMPLGIGVMDGQDDNLPTESTPTGSSPKEGVAKKGLINALRFSEKLGEAGERSLEKLDPSASSVCESASPTGLLMQEQQDAVRLAADAAGAGVGEIAREVFVVSEAEKQRRMAAGMTAELSDIEVKERGMRHAAQLPLDPLELTLEEKAMRSEIGLSDELTELELQERARRACAGM
jgi:hypothetical protein